MLFVGDDWAEDHHDVEVQDDGGRRLARARLPEGLVGIERLHALIGEHLPDELVDGDPRDAARSVVVGIETDRGPWVQALLVAGYQVYPVNPMSVARYRDRHSTSGAKSDRGDAHILADLVRLDRDRHRPLAGDSDLAEAVKVVARTHQSLIWDRQRHVLRLRSALREFFPAALQAFDDLSAAEAVELLDRAPSPTAAARLSWSKIAAAFARARRRDVDAHAEKVQELLRAPALRQPAVVEDAYAAVVTAQVRLIAALSTQIDVLAAQVDDHFGKHPDAEIYLSQPGIGPVLGARVLAEFGDDGHRYVDAKAPKNYAGTSPITKASGCKQVVLARHARNTRLGDALHQQAFSALRASQGARTYYDQLRARGKNHHAALRQLSNRLVGILHGCLKTRTCYDESTAWSEDLTAAA
ncbi:MAG: IS110 family transposase [Dermatophilaceae bacterium]